MTSPLNPSTRQRLGEEQNIWVATTRPDGRPHLTPVWFAWHDEKIYLCIQAASVKARNLAHNPRAALSLEGGSHPVICEGTARVVPRPWPEAVVQIFKAKYDWDITTDGDYDTLIEITPSKWLVW